VQILPVHVIYHHLTTYATMPHHKRASLTSKLHYTGVVQLVVQQIHNKSVQWSI